MPSLSCRAKSEFDPVFPGFLGALCVSACCY